jgi:hypothetical protein
MPRSAQPKPKDWLQYFIRILTSSQIKNEIYSFQDEQILCLKLFPIARASGSPNNLVHLSYFCEIRLSSVSLILSDSQGHRLNSLITTYIKYKTTPCSFCLQRAALSCRVQAKDICLWGRSVCLEIGFPFLNENRIFLHLIATFLFEF